MNQKLKMIFSPSMLTYLGLTYKIFTYVLVGGDNTPKQAMLAHYRTPD